MDRRTLFKAAAAALYVRPQADASARPAEGDVLVKAGDATQTPLKPADIPASGYITAWAMDPKDKTVRSGSRLNLLLVMRFDAGGLAADTRARAADGVVAYTSICTHQGCDIDQWNERDQHLFCSCHESTFDPKDGAKVVDGPAPRPLPALPLKVVDGALVVAKPFTAPVGYERG